MPTGNYARLETSQPPELVAAIRQQANRDGQSISEWVAEVAVANLDDDLAATVGERATRGRPPKTQNDKGCEAPEV